MRKFIIKIKKFFAKLMEVIGYIGAPIAIFGFWNDFPAYINDYRGCVFFILVVIVLLITGFLIWPKNSVSLKLSERVKANVFYGDIFKQKGVIVIPVNEYFDIIVDDKIIIHESLHGKFVKYFGQNKDNLKKKISDELKNVACIDTNSGRSYGNQERYPLGTVCQVEKDEKRFFLVALTKFNKNDRAEVKNLEYLSVLCDLFSYIDENSQGKKVNIPLIGAGHSGVRLSKQKLLEFLLLSVTLQDNLTLIGGVNIVLDSSIENEIYLNSIEILFNSIES